MMDNAFVFDEFTDVSYSVDERQKFDLFIPKTEKNDLPMMIFVHGGGWKSGSKSDYTDEMKRVCSKYPVCCLSVGYRFINEDLSVTYKDIQSDLANAIHTAQKYVESLGKSVTKKAIGGISAGAYNSMLYAFDKCEKTPDSFAFIVDKSGPCDLTDSECYKGTNELPKDMALRIYGQLMGFIFDEKDLSSPEILEKLKQASPIFHISRNSPAVLIAHSHSDEVVPLSCAKRLYDKLTSLGVKSDFVDMEGCGHSETIDYIEEKIRNKLDEYIEKYLLNT